MQQLLVAENLEPNAGEETEQHILDDQVWDLGDVEVPLEAGGAMYIRPAPPHLVGDVVRAVCQPAERRPRRSAPKVEIGSWQGRSLYLNLTQTYDTSWHDMRAVCLRHAGCMLSKSCRTQRPVGLLTAWLQQALKPECNSKELHRSFVPSREERQAARSQFKTLPLSHLWLEAEAPQPVGAPEEPFDQLD